MIVNNKSNKIQKLVSAILCLEKDEFEKSRSGVYSDNSKNRRLKRVGQKYGSSKQEDISFKDKKVEDDNKNEKNKTLDEYAKETSLSDLESSIKDSKDFKVREAAHKEIDRRKREEISKEDTVADMFIDKKDGVEYLKYRKRFDKAFDELSDEEKKLLINLKKVSLDPSRTPLSLDEIKEVKHMLYAVQGDLGDGMTVWRDNLMRWKVTTQGTGAMKLKYMAKILEKDIPDLLFNKNSIESMGRLEKSMTLGELEEYKNGYIQWRAFNQAYMNVVGMPDKVILYRGMSETEMAMNIYNSWKTGGMRRTLFSLNDVSVVGYSSDYDIAKKFGTSRNENDSNMMIQLIFRQPIERKNIVFPSALFDQLSRGQFVEEKEWLILGRKMKWNVKDMVLKIKNMKTDIWQTIIEF